MISTANITMQFGAKPLFENVSVKFGGGNRYGLIGANGCGKSTFMKILGDDLEPSGGQVMLEPNVRLGKLRQDQFGYEDQRVIDVVMMGHTEMWAAMSERDAIYANPLLLGFAWQMGWVPLQRASIERALTLNATQVERNLQAFTWGRHAAQDPTLMTRWGAPAQAVQWFGRGKPGASVQTLDELVQDRHARLVDYQDRAYAQRYLDVLARVRAAEQPLGSQQLSLAVARYLYKLMAFKDEYEVARLHTDPAFHERIAQMFEGDFKLNYHLAPPLLAKKNDKGELIKQKYGPAMLTAFKWLAKLKGLRGGALDVFGKTEERRMERALIVEYRACIDELLATLNADNLALAVEIARIPEEIRGYGHVKERHLKAARPKWDGLMAQWRSGKATEPRRQAA